MHRSTSIALCLVPCLSLLAGYGPTLAQPKRPLPLIRWSAAKPDWPDPATLPTYDARPAVVLLTQGVYAGRDCRTTIAGWRAWWATRRPRRPIRP